MGIHMGSCQFVSLISVLVTTITVSTVTVSDVTLDSCVISVSIVNNHEAGLVILIVSLVVLAEVTDQRGVISPR